LELFAQPFPTERKPSKCPTQEKKGGKEKQKKWGGEKANGKDEILLSAHARLNFESCNLASGTKASLVLDL